MDRVDGNVSTNTSDFFDAKLHQLLGVVMNGVLTQGELAAVSAAYAFIFLVGVVGNLLVAVVVLKVPHMRSPTNYLLLNLSVADLLVLIVCMPVSLVETWVVFPWILGDFMCYFSPYMEFVTFHASTLTIMAISVERYYVICRPLHCKERLTGRFMSIVLVVLWSAAFITGVPVLFITQFREVGYVGPDPVYTCETSITTPWAEAYLMASAAVFYFLPIVLLSSCCVVISRHLNDPDVQPSLGQAAAAGKRLRARKQVTYMLLAVAVLFFICLLPYRTTVLGFIYAPQGMYLAMGKKGMLVLIMICRIMVYINSTVNPVLYNITSTKFRNAFKQAINISGKKKTSRRTSEALSMAGNRRGHIRQNTTSSGASLYVC